MLLTFKDCELDTQLYALRRQGQPCQIEPLVFNLLLHLVEHRDRVVTREELFERIWADKVVGESTLNSCIKAARHAIGDDGQTQTCIATIPKRGYRFVAPVDGRTPSASLLPPTQIASASPEPWMPTPAGLGTDLRPRRASIAVMPFADLAAGAPTQGGLASALAHDVISRLAQLRSLFVIAQGTMFALSERQLPPRETGRLLGVDYLVSGSVQRQAGELIVSIELIEADSAHIVWADVLRSRRNDALQVLEDIGSQIVAHVASEVEASERNRALLKSPDALDAWEAHHRGLWHMYRFNREDNAQAQDFFQLAVRLDPTFARAYAGLSFTHFQNAFQGWTSPEPEIERAYATASQSLNIDQRNPASHWAMGRALWLRGQHDQSIAALQQAVELSPSFALGHYTLAFVHSQTGEAQAAVAASDQSRLLSPFDPLLFGMLSARGIALMRLGEFKEGADWTLRAALRSNAHSHIVAVAAYALALADRLPEARIQADRLQQMRPGYSFDDFLRTFHFDAEGAALFRQGAARLDAA